MTRDDFVDWKRDYRTQEVFDNLRARRLVILELMADPGLVDAPAMDRKTAQYIGHLQGLAAILDIDIDLDEVTDNAKDATNEGTWT